MSEKGDFENGIDGIDRFLDGDSVNKPTDDAIKELEKDPDFGPLEKEPTIFERVHERYLDEDRKGNFIRDD
jgi:hypothetical protein